MILALLLLVVPSANSQYRQDIQRWRDQRAARLQAPEGWLSVAGLFWLKPGPNRVGTAAEVDIALPAGAAPPQAGTIDWSGGSVRFHAAPGARATVNGRPASRAALRPDADRVAIGRLTLEVIERGGRYAIRLRDPESEMRRHFAGERWFPIDERWRIRARFVAYAAPKKLAFDTVVGVKEEMVCPGYAVFSIDGKEYRLEPVREGDGLFFVFRDATAGKETYGAGRFLNTGAPRNGAVVLDFNQAVNPPCAFTPYATCPLPPKQNRLTLAITAGEKNYPDAKH